MKYNEFQNFFTFGQTLINFPFLKLRALNSLLYIFVNKQKENIFEYLEWAAQNGSYFIFFKNDFFAPGRMLLR